LDWYESHNRTARIGFYVVEVLVILVSAAIPASAAAGGSVAAAGVLGALVTALVSVRALTGWRESWVRYGLTRASIQREVVRFGASVAPYGGQDAASQLIVTVEDIVAGENSQWASVRLQASEEQRRRTDSPQ
jgi:hypothetical protein